MTRTKIIVAAIAVAALSRVLPHPPNFTPLMAMALFGGACLACRWQAFLIPLTALFVSDLVLEALTRVGFYTGWLANGSGLHAGWWVVYGSFAGGVLIGMLVRRRRTILTVAGGALAASTLFFLVTNFAVWASGEMVGLYAMNWGGLLKCYEMGIPFWIDSHHWWTSPLFGDLLYTGMLFGAYALAERWVVDKKRSPVPALAG